MKACHHLFACCQMYYADRLRRDLRQQQLAQAFFTNRTCFARRCRYGEGVAVPDTIGVLALSTDASGAALAASGVVLASSG